MIDKKKLIDFIDAGKFRNADEICFSENDVVRLIKNFTELSNALGLNEQSKTDWIPCEERLPSEVGEYLVAYSNGDMTIQHFYGKIFSEIDSFNSIIACQPIAWQPLPQPYKKEGAE